jgi:tetratricopeptide (TPR) repeat protein
MSETVVDRAQEAVARGDWQVALALLVEADAEGHLGPAELPVLGGVAYAAGDLSLTVDAWERAHAACLHAGDDIAAAEAAVRVAMHLLFDTALMAPVRGWLRRAERLLEDHEETSAHVWLAVVRTYERMLSGDLDSARLWVRRAVDAGSEFDAAARTIGQVADARLRILNGDVQEGVATLAGDLDPLSTGVVYCELVCALQGLAQYDVAEEWTEAMERWSNVAAIGSLHGRCRLHRAEILRLRGSLDHAEREALAACEELRPYLRRELGWPLNELGRIRLRRGDIEGAEQAFLAAHRAGWDPEPGLALVHLARGDVAAASASIREALERPLRVPSKELPPDTDLQRAPLLEAQVEIEIAAGDLERARDAADELTLVAGRFQSKALVASAALVQGRVKLAQGDAVDARRFCSEAARLWTDVGAPFEAARARMCLADTLRASGSEQRADLELRAARAILDELHDLPSRPATPVFRPEGDSWSLEFHGHAVRVRDRKGIHYLARLIDNPGRDFHVLDLAAAEAHTDSQTELGHAPSLSRVLGDAGELLDERAKDAYRRRLAEIEEDIEHARALNDTGREEQADAEREFIVRELSRAIGLRGRDRRAASASERARVSVTRAIRHAIARIAEHDPRLADHLNRAIRTGTHCSYLP